jgi:hypothetical protein
VKEAIVAKEATAAEAIYLALDYEQPMAKDIPSISIEKLMSTILSFIHLYIDC